MPRNPNKIDYSGGFPENFQVFKALQDTRTGGNTLRNRPSDPLRRISSCRLFVAR